MATITSAGVGSGLDLESIIKASIDAENVPKLQAFVAKEEKLQVELSALGEIKSAVSQLEDTIKKLADPDNFSKRVATISQPSSGDVIKVDTTNNTTAGKYQIEVQQLAQGSRVVSNTGYSSASDVVTSSGGTLTFSAGAKSFDLSLDANATLSDLRNAINDSDSNFGVVANIINTGTESKLVLTSTETGAGNDLTITNNNSELDMASTIANGGGSGGLSIASGDTAKDAIIVVDGITIQNSSNVFKDAVQDMTITALKESSNNETAALNVDYDRDSITSLVDELIANYNNLVGNIAFQSRAGKPLNSDATMRSLSAQLVNTLSTPSTESGPFGSVFDIGLGVNKEGYLEKSSLVRSLNEAMDEGFDDIGKLFAGDNGIASKFETLLSNYVDSDGIIKQRQDSLNGELDNLEDDVANHEYRMEQLEIRLRKQYSSLDVLLAEMKASQSYLSSQLASLPGFTKASK